MDTALNEGDEEEDNKLSGSKRSMNTAAAPNFREIVSKRLRVSAISKYLNSNFVMFESKLPVIVKMDEYGMSNDDLVFRDIQSTESRYAIRDRAHIKQRLTHQQSAQSGGEGDAGNAENTSGNALFRESSNSLSMVNSAGQLMTIPQPKANPSKVIAVEERVQFTCDFKEFNLSGRLDLKAMRALIQKVAPVRLLVLRGSETDCDELTKLATTSNIEAFAPKNRRSVAFEVFTERLKLQIPRTLVPTNLQVVRPAGNVGSTTSSALAAAVNAASGTGDNANCTICVLRGEVSVTEVGGSSVNQEGSRVIKYLGTKEGSKQRDNTDEGVTDEDEDENNNGVSGVLPKEESSVRVVSLGEVTLGQLKQLLESANVRTEFKLTKSGGCLVCADQVIIRKDNNNFSIEGPPVKAFFEARRVLYNQFAFL